MAWFKGMSGKLVVAGIGLLGLLVIISGIFAKLISLPGPADDHVLVHVKAGSGPSAIAEQLLYAGAIDSPNLFKVAARLLHVDKKLQAGTYRFEPQASIRQIITKLTAGDVALYKVTVPEGLTTAEIITRLEQEESLKGEGIPMKEGSLFPSTYNYMYGDTVAMLLRRMAAKMDTELMQAWENRSATSELKSPEEMLILASIVEKEAGINDERPIVAAVYLNRLKEGMKLQADPTVIYGASNYDGNITNKHLKEDHPYNTYVHKGLPKGPISNPGRESLQAVANPANVDYLYFVSDGEGGHWFSKTHDEHEKNVQKYLKVYRSNLKKAEKEN